jgi:pyochelin biosynthesis protein PchC
MDLWLRRYVERPDAANVVVCFPHAGGSANYFRPLALALPESVELVAVQYPGRQDRLREPLIDDVATLAEQVTPLVAGLGSRPLALFGHSMGASVAFEVARRLERSGGSPVALFASARRPPSRPSVKRNHLASDEELVAAVRALGGAGTHLLDDLDFAELLIPLIRADYKAAESYVGEPGAVIDCPVIAIAGDTDPEVSPELARGWVDHTTGEFTLKVFEGNHFYLDHHTETLATLIARSAQSASPHF